MTPDIVTLDVRPKTSSHSQNQFVLHFAILADSAIVNSTVNALLTAVICYYITHKPNSSQSYVRQLSYRELGPHLVKVEVFVGPALLAAALAPGSWAGATQRWKSHRLGAQKVGIKHVSLV